MKRKQYIPGQSKANQWAQAAHTVLNDLRRQQESELIAAKADDWLMNMAVSILTFRELTGDNKKTEKYAQRLNAKLIDIRDAGLSTRDVIAELERVTGICLEVES